MSVKRVNYRERQTLTHRDLEDEQSYRLLIRHRHNIAHHGWGIVTGLALKPRESEFLIQPGMAVDGYGRELLVDTEIRVPWNIPLGLPDRSNEVSSQMPTIFEQLSPNCTGVDVWLVYRRVPVTPPHHDRYECGPGRHSRWREETYLRLTPGTAETDFNPRHPPDVPPEDWTLGPQALNGGDPDRPWPVFLGRLAKPNPTVTEKGKGPRSSVKLPGVYATLRGERIIAPSGTASVELGAEPGDPTGRFAVAERSNDGQLKERIVIRRAGTIELNGNTSLLPHDVPVSMNQAGQTENNDSKRRSDLFIEEIPGRASVDYCPPPGRNEVRPHGLRFQSIAEPNEAVPWNIYRVRTETGAQRLRLEMDHPGAEGARSSFGVELGYCEKEKADEKCKFVPVLNVAANRKFNVHGRLDVEGNLFEGPIEANLEDSRFTELLLNTDALRRLGVEIAATPKPIILVNAYVDNQGPPAPPGASYKVVVLNVGQKSFETTVVATVIEKNDNEIDKEIQTPLIPQDSNVEKNDKEIDEEIQTPLIPQDSNGIVAVGKTVTFYLLRETSVPALTVKSITVTAVAGPFLKVVLQRDVELKNVRPTPG